ncbi:orotate phosphoribosyltransferase [Kribbella capetownensis]|uniref:Orotate phosphoribosyltransferase n=1 Tax=Kribbella capetownensis TaxID=1572659 RepID=A0A4R0JQ79_9ACTN|nr:phosphoribosyltransferase family protein [Kribbella capetownensis]TCC44155.1 orotate phosphoribosyltransferase [Kribbella capetownensis]
MELNELGRRIYASAHLTGEFLLRSGQVTGEYFDKYRFEADPVLLDAVAEAMVPLVPEGTEVLAGLEMGGIPVVTALGRQTGLPCAFVRKEAKAYGTRRLAEGAETAGKRVTIVEDVVTTGGQIVLSTHDLRALGAEITDALCVINRNPTTPAPLTEAGLTLHALLTSDDLAPGTS